MATMAHKMDDGCTIMRDDEDNLGSDDASKTIFALVVPVQAKTDRFQLPRVTPISPNQRPLKSYSFTTARFSCFLMIPKLKFVM